VGQEEWEAFKKDFGGFFAFLMIIMKIPKTVVSGRTTCSRSDQLVPVLGLDLRPCFLAWLCRAALEPFQTHGGGEGWRASGARSGSLLGEGSVDRARVCTVLLLGWALHTLPGPAGLCSEPHILCQPLISALLDPGPSWPLTTQPDALG
jgi:hypothetical protein